MHIEPPTASKFQIPEPRTQNLEPTYHLTLYPPPNTIARLITKVRSPGTEPGADSAACFPLVP